MQYQFLISKWTNTDFLVSSCRRNPTNNIYITFGEILNTFNNLAVSFLVIGRRHSCCHGRVFGVQKC